MKQPDLLSPAQLAHSLQLLRQQAPLVHCMTNDVVQTFTANVLLALQASPAMVIDPEEAAQFAGFADALLINVGTLTRDRPADDARGWHRLRVDGGGCRLHQLAGRSPAACRCGLPRDVADG